MLDYRIHERRRRAVLARVSEISLREARQRAGSELSRIRAGESDPLTRRQEAREAPTVNDGLDRFFGEYAPARIATERLTERTARDYRGQADRHLCPSLGKRLPTTTTGSTPKRGIPIDGRDYEDDEASGRRHCCRLELDPFTTEATGTGGVGSDGPAPRLPGDGGRARE